MNRRGKMYVYLLALIVLMLMPQTVSAAQTDSDFVVKDGVLTAYTGDDTDVEIPNTVTEIGESVFFGNTTIKKVIIPSSVKKVADDAFTNTDITELEIYSTSFLEEFDKMLWF